MNKPLTYFRLLTIQWAVLLGVAVYYFFQLHNIAAVIALVIALATIAFQVVEFKCTKCGAHPAAYFFAFWTAFVDPVGYFIDTLVTRECPKCEHQFVTTEPNS